MRDKAWIIPWLLPLAMLLVVLVGALAPTWALGVLGAAIAFGFVPLIWRVYTREHPDRQLPDWLPGGRPPR